MTTTPTRTCPAWCRGNHYFDSSSAEESTDFVEGHGIEVIAEPVTVEFWEFVRRNGERVQEVSLHSAQDSFRDIAGAASALRFAAGRLDDLGAL